MEGTATAITTALGEIVDIMTTNVLPLLTSTPLVYFLALSLFGVGCGVFARARGII